MSLKAYQHVWEHSRQEGSTLLVQLAIADYAHDDGSRAYPSIKTLAAKARMSERNVQYALRRLEADGELRVDPKAGPNHANAYTLLFPPTSDQGGAKFAPPRQSSGANQRSQVVQTSAPGGANQRGGVVQNDPPSGATGCTRSVDPGTGSRTLTVKDPGSPPTPPFASPAKRGAEGDKKNGREGSRKRNWEPIGRSHKPRVGSFAWRKAQEALQRAARLELDGEPTSGPDPPAASQPAHAEEAAL